MVPTCQRMTQPPCSQEQTYQWPHSESKVIPLPIATGQDQGPGSTSALHVDVSTVLILYRFYKCNPVGSELVSAAAVLSPEDSVSCLPTFQLLQSFHLPLLNAAGVLRSECVVDTDAHTLNSYESLHQPLLTAKRSLSSDLEWSKVSFLSLSE